MADHIVMLAGEASGDKLAGMILAEMAARGYKPSISGVGGTDMQAQGLQSVFPMEDLTVLGITGAIVNYPKLKRRLNSLVDHIRTTKPRFILTVDSKAFSLRLGKALKKVMAREGWSIPIIHLVAPTVWAWAGWRAKTIGQSVDHLLCLFPFEVPYFTKYGTDAHAVGHPAADITFPKKNAARKILGLDVDDQVVGLFPGSRRGEIAMLLPDMCLAVQELRKTRPDLKAVLPASRAVHHLIEEFLTDEDGVQLVDEDHRYDVMKAADYGLICSGTVTLETALAGLHGSVYYRSDALSMFIGKKLVDLTKVILPNAITGLSIYALALGKDFTPSTMANAAEDHFNAGDPTGLDIAAEIKTALTPSGKAGKRGSSFQKSVVDTLDQILNGL